MKLTLFLYNFAKIFIPGTILLCLIFGVAQHIPKVINLPQKTPSITHKKARNVVPAKKTAVPSPAQPNYIYIVEFKSGGTMKAQKISKHNKIVSLWVDDGYRIKISQNDIQKIKKYRQ